MRERGMRKMQQKGIVVIDGDPFKQQVALG